MSESNRKCRICGRGKPDSPARHGTEWTVERASMAARLHVMHTWRRSRGTGLRVTFPQKGGTIMTTVRHRPESEALLTPSEVATLFRVDPKTVTRWAKAGKLTSIRTLGGHRRYRESEVRSLLDGNTANVQS